MHGATGFLGDLAVVLCVAALTTVLFQRLRLPVVLGYLLAGLLVGPHVPLPPFADLETVQELSELGVIVLMFSIGLEFSVRRLLRLGPSAGVIATIEVGLMIWLGYLAAQAFGWEPRLSFATGVLVSISSTMIVSRTFAELGVERSLSDLVFGILVVEDLYAILLIAVLTALAGGEGLSTGEFALGVLRLIVFLVLLIALGLLFVPRLLSFVAKLGSRETTLVASIGLCFAFALVAESFGYSVALGAFIAGVLAAESGEARRIELLVRPVRDVFGAIFFVSIGMLVDPRLLLEHWHAIVVLTLLVVVGKVVGVSLGALVVGHRTETAVRAGMSLAQIGEFSFLVAGVALVLGKEAGVLPPVAVAICVVTAALTPALNRRASAFGRLVDLRLPRPLRTFLSLYATWLEKVRSRRARVTLWTRVRRVALWMTADAFMLVVLVAGAAISRPPLVAAVHEATALSNELLDAGVLLLATFASLPFAIGVVRCVRRLGAMLAAEMLPEVAGELDLAAAPRRALVAGLQFALLILVALPVLALTQPFLPPLPGVGALALLLLLAFWGLWRSASNLEGHVRAGAAMILEVLARQGREAQPPTLEGVRELLPGLGDLTPVRIDSADGAVGCSVTELNLHGRSGASILCISRSGEGLVAPTGEVRFAADDVLTLAGAHAAVAAAREVLTQGLEPGSKVDGA